MGIKGLFCAEVLIFPSFSVCSLSSYPSEMMCFGARVHSCVCLTSVPAQLGDKHIGIKGLQDPNIFF